MSDMADIPHLLLVDDERSIREPLAQYLTKQGFRVTQAASAAEIHRTASSAPPRSLLHLIDIRQVFDGTIHAQYRGDGQHRSA